MRVLVTGSKTFRTRDWLWAALDLLHSRAPITEIIESGSSGAAVRAYEWAGRREVKCTTVLAEWERLGNAALADRHTRMAQLRPDVVLVCPGGPETANMVEIAHAHGLRVIYLEKMPVPRGADDYASEPPEVVIDAVAA